MYNRYIGNTGKFYRVDDTPHERSSEAQNAEHRREAPPIGAQYKNTSNQNHVHARPNSSGSLFNLPEILGGVKGLVNGILPKGTDVSDLLLILVLLLLYLEKEDEEILIMLSVLIFMGFK